MNPTEEQTAVVETEAPILVVRAFAGAGKTSTLLEFAKKRSQKRMLYIVFSKQNQKDAEQKFKGTMVKPTTSHALAFRYTGVPYKDQLVAGLKPYQVEKALGIGRELSSESGYRSSYNNDMMVASVVLESLIKFLYSTDKEINAKDELFLKREYSAAMVENTNFEKWLSETEMQSAYVKNSLRQAYWAGYNENSIAQGLAVMIIRLVRRVRKISPDDDISIIAMDYLKRIGLPIGTPLRDI